MDRRAVARSSQQSAQLLRHTTASSESSEEHNNQGLWADQTCFSVIWPPYGEAVILWMVSWWYMSALVRPRLRPINVRWVDWGQIWQEDVWPTIVMGLTTEHQWSTLPRPKHISGPVFGNQGKYPKAFWPQTHIQMVSSISFPSRCSWENGKLVAKLGLATFWAFPARDAVAAWAAKKMCRNYEFRLRAKAANILMFLSRFGAASHLLRKKLLNLFSSPKIHIAMWICLNSLSLLLQKCDNRSIWSSVIIGVWKTKSSYMWFLGEKCELNWNALRNGLILRRSPRSHQSLVSFGFWSGIYIFTFTDHHNRNNHDRDGQQSLNIALPDMSNVYDNDDYHDGDNGDHDDDGQQGPGLGLSPSPICPIKGLAASVQSQPRVAKMMTVMIIISRIDVQ